MVLWEYKLVQSSISLFLLIRNIEMFTFLDVVILRFYYEKSNALKFDRIYFMIGRRNINV